MERYEMINDIFVNLFRDIWDMEEKALITEQFKDISVNDMHILEAIGMDEPRNMSAVAKLLDVTVGTLTTAINSLVKKGYVKRIRSAQDRRVVLVSLDKKGVAAYNHHREFHKKMVLAIVDGLSEEDIETLVAAMNKLRKFFYQYA